MDAELTVTELNQIHDAGINYFNTLFKRADENERFYSADPFTDKQKAAYSNQERLAFSISSIPNKLNTVIAAEKQNRSEWKVKPILEFVNSEDTQEIQQEILSKELKAAIATTRLKTIARTNTMKNIASDIFASGVAVMYGAGEVYTEKNVQGNDVIKLRDLDYKNVIWDKNALSYEKNDGAWMAKRDFRYRSDLIKQYGKKAANLAVFANNLMWNSREKQQYYIHYNKDGISDLDLLSVFTHFHRVLRDYYTIVFNGEVVAKEKTNKAAQDILDSLQIPYLVEGEEAPAGDIIRTPEFKIDKYVFTYTDVLEYTETDLAMFPISIYQAFHFKNRIWTLTDILKSMQQLANRMLSQIDYAFGKDIKNVYEIVMPHLEGTGYSVKEALTMMKEKGILPTNKAGTLKAVESRGANPQWVQIMEIMLRLIDEIGGGKTFSGSANSGSQSGKAINALIGQGELLTAAFIDNRNRFQADLASKVMEHMKLYDNTPYIIKTEAGALTESMIQLLQKSNMYIPHPDQKTAGYVRMNSENNYLEDFEYEMSVEFEDISAGKKDAEYERMIMQEKTDPELILSPTWRKMKLSKLTGITYEEQSKIQQEIDEGKQQQQQQAEAARQEELNIKKADILMKNSSKEKELPAGRNLKGAEIKN